MSSVYSQQLSKRGPKTLAIWLGRSFGIRRMCRAYVFQYRSQQQQQFRSMTMGEVERSVCAGWLAGDTYHDTPIKICLLPWLLLALYQ